MRDLIARLESAMGPDRELDLAIAQAIGWRHVEGQAWLKPEDAADAKRRKRSALLYARHSVPLYTASLDAALTLVPADCGVVLSAQRGMSPAWATTRLETTAKAPTLALALCIAALRAREAAHA